MDPTKNQSKGFFYINLNNSNSRLTITRLDTVNHIMSGEFSGRFDTKLTHSHF